MGQRYRRNRSLVKNSLRNVLPQVAPVLSIKEARRMLRDPGYKETEYGELRSTIRKLTYKDILSRIFYITDPLPHLAVDFEEDIMTSIMSAATRDIYSQADEMAFKDLELACVPA